MAEGGSGNANCNGSEKGNSPPSSPTEDPGPSQGTFDSSRLTTDQEHGKLAVHEEIREAAPAKVVRRRQATEQDNALLDEELRQLGLWEEGMTDDEKVKLLHIVAESKETARREEAVRKSHFAWQTVPADVVRNPWQNKEPPVGLAKPCLAASELPACSDRMEHTPRMNIAVGNKDGEWPVLGEVPPRRKVATPRKSNLALSTRRVCSMDQPLNFEFEDEHRSDDLYDIRVPHKDKASSSADERKDSSEVEDIPAGENLPSPSPPRILPEAATAAVSQGEGLQDPVGLMESWATVAKALKVAQSGEGLPVRPWGHPRDPSSIGGDEECKPQDLGNPPKQDPPKGGPGGARAVEDAQSRG
ncbi:uncharacterized protein LOC144138556 [Haemaphysalis longicornis]